jgi:hypothetical protein
VVWLKDAVWHDHLHCKVYIGGREQHNVEDIRSFQHGEQTHWRITFNNGYVQDYLHGSIQVVESCLADDIANNAFEFLKRIAQVNELGKDEERKYISHYATHLDFLIVNHVSKKPLLAIETDGYNFHNDETDQHRRDEMKNHILEVYGLPLLRLSTTGSGEKGRIVRALENILYQLLLSAKHVSLHPNSV